MSLQFYCYLKGNQFIEDTINLVRFSVVAPLIGSAEKVLQDLGEFAALMVYPFWRRGAS